MIDCLGLSKMPNLILKVMNDIDINKFDENLYLTLIEAYLNCN